MLNSISDMNTSEEKYWVSSAEIIGNNQDVLPEILLRIPAKPLLKFKCVSKQWFSLISDPKFCICHARRQKILNPTPNALLLNKGYSSTHEFQIVPLNDTTKVPSLEFLDVPRIKILQSCNGLLLCCSTYLLKPSEQQWRKSKTEMGFEQVPITPPWYKDYCSSVVDDDDCGYRCFICNANTRQFKRLAFPSHISEGFGPFGVFLNLAFDPLKSPYCKVILLHVLDAMMDKYEIHVYSSKDESWTRRGIPFRWPFTTVISPGVFCNGSIHWYSREATSPYFDVDNETLNTMPTPRMQNILYFGESCGHLHMVVTTERSSLPLEFNVLEMASDYSGWFVRYHVDLCSIRTVLPELSWHHGQNHGTYSVLSIIQAEKEEESTIVLFLNGAAISYNPFNGTSNKLCNLKPSPRDSRELVHEGCNAYQYFETLACV